MDILAFAKNNHNDPSVLRRWFFCIFILFFACTALPKSGGELLRVHLESEPFSLDITKASGLRESQIISCLYEGLTRHDPKTLEPLPAVAARWEISPDGKTYTFFLRKEAHWSDSTHVTAEDFWRAWERMLNPLSKSGYAFILFPIRNATAYNNGQLKDPSSLGIKVMDPHTFRVELEHPTAYFLDLTAFAKLVPMHEGTLEKYNGPFVLSQWTPKKEMILRKNPLYWRKEEVSLKGIEFRFLNDFLLALQHYDAKSIDILADLQPEKVDILRWGGDFQNAPILRTEYFMLNVEKPPLNDVRFRRALSLAIDREFITSRVLKKGDIPYGLFIPSGLSGYTSPDFSHRFSPEAARQLFQQVGWKGTLNIYYNNAPDRKLVAEAVQKMWENNLGLKTNLVGEEWNDYLKRRRAKNYQISWGGWYGDYLDPTTFLDLFVGTKLPNYTNWNNARYDQLVQEAHQMAENSQRALLLQQAEEVLLKEGPVIPVLVKAKNYLIQPYVAHYYSNLLDVHPLSEVQLVRH